MIKICGSGQFAIIIKDILWRRESFDERHISIGGHRPRIGSGGETQAAPAEENARLYEKIYIFIYWSYHHSSRLGDLPGSE